MRWDHFDPPTYHLAMIAAQLAWLPAIQAAQKQLVVDLPSFVTTVDAQKEVACPQRSRCVEAAGDGGVSSDEADGESQRSNFDRSAAGKARPTSGFAAQVSASRRFYIVAALPASTTRSTANKAWQTISKALPTDPRPKRSRGARHP